MEAEIIGGEEAEELGNKHKAKFKITTTIDDYFPIDYFSNIIFNIYTYYFFTIFIFKKPLL